MLEITLWDENATRLQNCHANLSKALKKFTIKVNIICQSEPPLLSRMGLVGSCPCVEVNENYWRLRAGEEISEKDFILLLQQVINLEENIFK